MEFKIDEFKILSSIVIIASDKLDKEHIICLLMENFTKIIPVGIVVNDNLIKSKNIDKICNNTKKHSVFCIHNKYEDTIIDKLLLRQELIINKNKTKEHKINTNSLLILNDCVKLPNDNIKKIILNSKCYNIEFILAINIPEETQYIIKEFDYILLLSDETVENIEKIYEYVKDKIDTFDMFLKIYKCLTKNNSVLVINDKKIYWMTL